MKRSVKSIILLAVLVLLIGGYYLTQNLTRTVSVTEETGTFALTDKTSEDLVGISWTKDDVSYHFVREDDLWVNADDAAFPVNQDAVQALADDLFGIAADRKIEDVQKVADYGLDVPVFTVAGEWSDGTTTEYAMGDATPFGDGYYLKLSGSDTTVYTVANSLNTMFSDTLVDLAQPEEIPAVENADRLTVGTSLDVSFSETSSTLDPQQNWYASDGTAVDDAAVEELVEAAQSIEWNELLTASATGEELTGWNLTDDAATALTVYENGEPVISLLIGATDDSGNYYARLSDSTMVYTVTSDSVSSLREADPADLASTVLIPLAFEDLSEAAFTLNGLTYAYARTETEVTAEATEETEATAATEVSVTLNGEETDAAVAEEVWSIVSSLAISGNTDAATEGESLLRIHAVNENGISAEFEFCGYDADSYLVVCSDGSTALTNADSVDKLIRNLRQLG